MERGLGRRQQGRALTLFDDDAASVDQDETGTATGKLGSAPRVDRVENHAPGRLVGHGRDTLGDDLRVPARGGEDFSRLQCPSDDAQTRQATKSTGENEGNPYPPASASSHHLVPAALTSRSAILTAAGIWSCYRNRNAGALWSPLERTRLLPRHNLIQPLVDVAGVNAARGEVITGKNALQERNVGLHTLDDESL